MTPPFKAEKNQVWKGNEMHFFTITDTHAFFQSFLLNEAFAMGYQQAEKEMKEQTNLIKDK